MPELLILFTETKLMQSFFWSSVAIYKFIPLFYLVYQNIYNTSPSHLHHKIFTFYLETSFSKFWILSHYINSVWTKARSTNEIC